MKIEKIYPETLRQLIVEVLKTSTSFSYVSGTQPFLIRFNDREYYIYVKNLSSAYFKERPDTTRAQLPKKEYFEEIKKSTNTFVFFGYDQKNDVLVCWNFHNVKTRLNEKKSVSFYSRQFFQDEVMSGKFLRKQLKNGDEPILFKRRDLVAFFNQIDGFFPFDGNSIQTFDASRATDSTKDEQEFVSEGKLLRITDEGLIAQIKPLLETKHTLQALKLAADFYKGKFPKMQLADWSKLVKQIAISST